MNCYTVRDGQVQLGIALRSRTLGPGLALSLGEKTGQAGQEVKIGLSPRDPASHVLVAGGIHLMRTCELHRTDEKPPRYLLVRAKWGLKADTTDRRALVLLDFVSGDTSLGYTSKTYQEIAALGFECLGNGPGLYHVQALVILKPGEHIMYRTTQISRTVHYDFDETCDKFPRLYCTTSEDFLARNTKKTVVV